MPTSLKYQRSPAQRTQLRARGRAFTIKPLDLDLLAAAATVKHHLIIDDDDGFHLERDLEYLADADRSFRQPLRGRDFPLVHFPLGLEPVIRHVVRKNGGDIEYAGEWAAPLTDPDSAIRCFGAADDALFDLVQHHHAGLIRRGRTVDVVHLIARIALAWPKSEIAVAVKRVADVRRIARTLRRHEIDALGITTGRDPQRRPHVVVGTFESLGGSCANLPWRHILIAVDAVEMLGKVGQISLQHAERARLYGVLHLDRKIAPRDEAQLRAYFGFYEVSLPRRGHVLRPVEVVWLPIAGGPRIPAHAELFVVLRDGVGRHPVRNRRIARLARAIRSRDRSDIDQRFPAVTAALYRQNDLEVAILVDGVEQGLALAKLLPGWSLVTSSDVWVEGLSVADRELLEEAADRPAAGPQRILTASALPTVSLAGVDVLIRADAGTGLPAALGDLSVSGNSKPRSPLLLIDFLDRHHPILRRRRRRRENAYGDHGWYRAGSDPVEERVKQFLATRPGGSR